MADPISQGCAGGGDGHDLAAVTGCSLENSISSLDACVEEVLMDAEQRLEID
jgi:hypothetical protein